MARLLGDLNANTSLVVKAGSLHLFIVCPGKVPSKQACHLELPAAGQAQGLHVVARRRLQASCG